eukprot:1684307-Pyramimonas_sp.AAC.1
MDAPVWELKTPRCACDALPTSHLFTDSRNMGSKRRPGGGGGRTGGGAFPPRWTRCRVASGRLQRGRS